MYAKKLSLSLLVLCSLTWQPASAIVFCEGTVKSFYVADTSAVLIHGSWMTDWTQVCNVKVAWKGIDPELCKTWFSAILAAYHGKTTFMVRYDDPSVTDCAALPTDGNTPAPEYVMGKPW